MAWAKTSEISTTTTPTRTGACEPNITHTVPPTMGSLLYGQVAGNLLLGDGDLLEIGRQRQVEAKHHVVNHE
jgi:hypothetical protein